MTKLIISLLILVVHYAECQFEGIFLNTGGCLNFTPATNIDVDRSSTAWSVMARSRISYVETGLDCSRIVLTLNNFDKSEIAIYVRSRGTNIIHGTFGFLGFAISSHIGSYNILEVVGMTSFYLKGSVWILDTDNETYCILVICNSVIGIGNSHVYILTRGTAPDNIVQITNVVLQNNKLNPRGLIWGVDRNC